MNRTTILRVTVECEYTGDEFEGDIIPTNTYVQDLVSVEIPRVEEKYIEFPKLIQGVIMAAYSRHTSAVMDALIKKAKEDDKAKKEAEERQRMTLFSGGVLSEAAAEMQKQFPDTELIAGR